MTETVTLTRWTIRRSGAGLAITGTDKGGALRTVSGIPQIYPADQRSPRPYGVGTKGVRVELANG